MENLSLKKLCGRGDGKSFAGGEMKIAGLLRGVRRFDVVILVEANSPVCVDYSVLKLLAGCCIYIIALLSLRYL